jgi:hypothetical protein
MRLLSSNIYQSLIRIVNKLCKPVDSAAARGLYPADRPAPTAPVQRNPATSVTTIRRSRILTPGGTASRSISIGTTVRRRHLSILMRAIAGADGGGLREGARWQAAARKTNDQLMRARLISKGYSRVLYPHNANTCIGK